MEARIREVTNEALTALDATDVSFVVEWPGDMSHGDFAINAALVAAKKLGKNPKELATELAARIEEKLGTEVSKIEVAGPGFINITFSREYITEQVRIAKALGSEFGKVDALEGKRIAIEYSCPNPFKEMHIGHMMSTIIGEAVARLMENAGGQVTRDTYGGDVGPHVAKALWALKQKGITDPATPKEIGDAYAHGSRSYEESENAKAEIDALNVALYTALAKEQNDLTEEERELLSLWKKGREVSFESFQDIYRLLDTHFDYFIFESEVTPIGMEVVLDGVERGVFEKSEGAIVYKGEKKGLHTLVFITSRGTPTYEAKDIGLAFLKEERIPNDASYILTAAEQIGHFNVFLAALEDIAPLVAQKTKHIPHGFLRLTTGKMSSREGNVITAEGLMKEVLTHAMERNTDPIVAEQVAMGALKYMILRSSPGSDIIFDPEKSLSLEGDSGPYLQYAVVRAKSVIAQPLANEDKTVPSEPYVLERLLMRFPEVALQAEQERAPHHLVKYLTQLAGEWNSFYAQQRIVGGEYESYKREVAETFISVMTNGLTLLAIPVPEKM